VSILMTEMTPAKTRRVKVVALAVVGLSFFSVICIQIYARLFRFRTERLLSVLRTFQVEETPAATVLRLRSDYLSHVTDHGPCTEARCEFSVVFTQWESLIWLTASHPWTERPTYYLVRGFRFFGLRINYFMATLLVQDGKLRRLSVGLRPMSHIEYGSPDEHGFLSNIGIGADTVGNFRRWLDPPQLYVHPNLYVWKPNACTGCSGAINVDFTWQASRDEYERALKFDLSCITRFRDCRTPEEYLPSAGKVLKDDHVRNLAEMWGKMPCDARRARVLGRDSDFVDVVRIRRFRSAHDDLVSVDYDLLKTLKGNRPVLDDIYHRKADVVATPNSNSSESLLKVGAERIIFLSEILGRPTDQSNCSVMILTPEILTATLEGITADRSSILGTD
jgi:hypothetical protein